MHLKSCLVTPNWLFEIPEPRAAPIQKIVKAIKPETQLHEFLGRMRAPLHFQQQPLQFHQFTIFRVPEPAEYRDPIIDLQSKAIDDIIDDQNVVQIPIQDPQIFDKLFLKRDTMISIQPVFEYCSLRIQKIYDLVCVLFNGCGESDNLIFWSQIF